MKSQVWDDEEPTILETQQDGVSTRVPLMIHNCDVLVLYETFMNIGDTISLTKAKIAKNMWSLQKVL